LLASFVIRYFWRVAWITLLGRNRIRIDNTITADRRYRTCAFIGCAWLVALKRTAFACVIPVCSYRRPSVCGCYEYSIAGLYRAVNNPIAADSIIEALALIGRAKRDALARTKVIVANRLVKFVQHDLTFVINQKVALLILIIIIRILHNTITATRNLADRRRSTFLIITVHQAVTVIVHPVRTDVIFTIRKF
jgi:hypothetical protein